MTQLVILGASALLACVSIALAQPLLRSYALARPNARSSHKVPTPQGGGIFIVAAILVVVAAAAFVQPLTFGALSWVLAATVLLAAVGTADDILMLGAAPRLVLQAIAVGMVLWSLPDGLHVVPFAPWWLDRVLLLVAGVWLVNLVNFMDGIDWMTVAEVVPVSAALALFGALGELPSEGTVTAFALCGAMLGFAPFNRPVARLFLGDVGSLPVGLLLGWLLVLLAGNGHLAAALLLPLYYVADATITLLTRIARGAPVMTAHRGHFYQRAFDGGMRVQTIVGGVFALNVALAVLALTTLTTESRLAHAGALAAGVALVALLLLRFAGVRR